MLLVVCFGGLFTPFVIVAGVVATTMVFFTPQSDPPHRKYILLAGVLTLVTPYFAELAGFVAQSTALAVGKVVILPRVIQYSPAGTQIVLLTMHALLGVAPASVAFGLRDQLVRAERQLSRAAWRMSQMVTDLCQDRPRAA